MHIGSHHDHVGLGEFGVPAQCLGDVAIESRQIQDAYLDAMAREMRSDLGTENCMPQILLAQAQVAITRPRQVPVTRAKAQNRDNAVKVTSTRSRKP